MPRTMTKVQQQVRDTEIWKLHTESNKSYSAIAEQKQMPYKTVVSVCRRMAALRKDDVVEDVETLRAAEAARLDSLIGELTVMATETGDEKVYNTLLKYMESKRKLLRLDLPERIELEHRVVGTVEDEFQALLDQMGALPPGMSLVETVVPEATVLEEA